MPSIYPYVHFNGNAEDAFSFYQSVFGSPYIVRSRFKDVPSAAATFSAEESEKIMHIELPIGQQGFLMGSDVPQFMGRVSEMENRTKLFLKIESLEEANTIFNALAVNGSVEVPLAQSFLGAYFGMLRDQYGIEWMISFTSPVN
jgi:PhnB protein